MKKRRLKKEVKIVLFIIMLIISVVFITKALNRVERIGHMCDIEKGHTCTLYEVQEYARQLGGE